MWATSPPAIRRSSARAAPRRFTGSRSRLSATKTSSPSTSAAGKAAERRALWYYRLRGYRVLDANVWSGGNELDLVVRRGRRLVFCEVKAKADERFGDPLEMVTAEKQRRLRRAAEAWLAARPELGGLELSFEVIALRAAKLDRLKQAF